MSKGKLTNGADIDLGLAILSVLRWPDECLTNYDIAAWCGCSPQAIDQIYCRAIRKLRHRLGPEALELIQYLE